LKWIDVDVKWMRYVGCLIFQCPFLSRIQVHALVNHFVLEELAINRVPRQIALPAAPGAGFSVENQWLALKHRSIDVGKKRRLDRKVSWVFNEIHRRGQWVVVLFLLAPY